MPQQECDLQTLLRKLNEIDKRTKDTEQALKLLGQSLIRGDFGGGSGGGNKAQNVDFRRDLDNYNKLNKSVQDYKNSIIDLRPYLKDAEDTIRRISGSRTVQDLKSGGGDLRQTGNDAREAKVVSARLEKLLKEVVVQLGTMQSDVKAARTKSNNAEFNTKTLIDLVRPLAKKVNDMLYVVNVLNPIIKETRKLANDSFFALLTFSPLIRKTDKNVNDTLFVVNKIRSLMDGIAKNANDAAFAAIRASSKADTIIKMLNDMSKWGNILASLQVALSLLTRPKDSIDYGPLINGMWSNLLLVIRGEGGATRNTIGGQITANTTVLRDRIAYAETWLTNILRSDKAAIIDAVFNNTAGIPVKTAQITAVQAAGVNAHTSRGLLALLDQITEAIKKSGGDPRILGYLQAAHKVLQVGTYSTVDVDGKVTFKSVPLAIEDYMKGVGAQLFANGSNPPLEPGGQSLPGGTIGIDSPWALNLAMQSLSHHRLGLHRLPASVPEKIHYTPTLQTPKPPQVVIDSMVDFQNWQFKQLDSALGFFPLVLKHKNRDGVVTDVKVENISEGLSELIGLAIVNDSDTDVILETLVRASGEVIQIKGMSSLAIDYLQSQTDFMGYKHGMSTKKMPVTLNPLDGSIKGWLTNTELEIQKHEYKDSDDNDIISKINKLLVIGAMLQATFHKRYPVIGGIGLDGDQIKRELNIQDTEWDKFVIWLKTQYAQTGDVGGDANLSKPDVTDKSSRLISGTNPP